MFWWDLHCWEMYRCHLINLSTNLCHYFSVAHPPGINEYTASLEQLCQDLSSQTIVSRNLWEVQDLTASFRTYWHQKWQHDGQAEPLPPSSRLLGSSCESGAVKFGAQISVRAELPTADVNESHIKNSWNYLRMELPTEKISWPTGWEVKLN